MVFESVVTDVLNRFLGDYVQNLDANQLKIGIWGGDVVLQNLELKQSALSELDLPIQTVYGRLDKLVLKIPWKNLYGASVEASVEGLSLLVQPNSEVFYDPQKEDIKEQDFKKAQLDKLEQVKAMKDMKKPDDSFVEKLVAQIVKNVQLSVKKIHIRYENKSAEKPFAMGITLNSLQVHTTDDNWVRAVVQEAVTKIYKVVSLEGLSVYWNCETEMFSDITDKNELIECFQRDIANREQTPENYNYILAPINSDARLILNMKPENDKPPFKYPKSHAQLVVENLKIGITKMQYRDIITFAESMSLMTKGLPYRKYRPNVKSYKGNYKEWWKFAYTCILETEVRRRRRNWDWEHMLSHIRLCKDYGEAYKTKKSGPKKVPPELQLEIDNMEKRLDFFSIVLIRERIELELKKLDQIVRKPRGWMGIFWNPFNQSSDEDTDSTTNILSKFQQAMTSEEKEKLFKAIDYQENMKPQTFPVEYVGIVVKFHLKTFQIEVRNEADAPPVLLTKLQNVRCNIQQRPRNDALKVAVKIEKLTLYGMEQDNLLPEIISSQVDETGTLLDVLFETNPLDSSCGQKIHVNVQPLKIVHDAATIRDVISIFKVPSNSALEQLSQVTAAQLSNLKDLSATGLQYAIEEHVKIDLDIKVSAPYIILPYGGMYTGDENVLVVNLGRLRLKSDDKQAVTVQEMAKRGTDRQEMINEMIASSYDRYLLDIYNIQILLAQSDEDWLKCIDVGNKSNGISEGSPLHILEPVDLHIVLETCLISNDAKLPAMKISGELPSIRVNITDTRLLLLLSLVNSIPTDMGDSDEIHPLVKTPSSASLFKYLDINEPTRKTVVKKPSTDPDLPQLTKLKLDFELKDISLKLSHQEMLSSPIQEVANLNVHSVKLVMIQQTYNMTVDVSLESISMTQWIQQISESIDIISTPLQNSNCLFNVHFLQVDKTSPKFATKYNSCVSLLSFEFATLAIRLHQEALHELMRFASDVQNQMNDTIESKPKRRSTPSISSQTSNRSSLSYSTKLIPNADEKNRNKKTSIINLKLLARVHEVSLIFEDIKNPISKVTIGGISSEIIMKNCSTQIDLKMADLTILDLNLKNIHNKILRVEKGEEAFHINLIIYNRDTCVGSGRPDDVDMAISIKLGCLRVSFVNWFIVNKLNFLDGFQAAQKAIAEASEKAARSAKANMQSFYENATKISLDIHLKAPDILIPESSQCYRGLKIDLGHITIRNKFNILEIHNEAGNPVVIDDLQLKLDQLQIDSIEYDEELEPINNVTMLKPLTFDLNVHRNLSGWYKAVPDLDIVGNIDTIQLMLGTTDYQTVMSVLNKNLSEGERNVVENMERFESVDTRPSIAQAIQNANETEPAAEKEDDQIITTLRWNFVMNCFKINLFNISESGERVGLAEMSLEGFAVRGRMLSNNSISNALLLVNCLLIDMRPGREDKITCLLSRTQEKLNEDRGTYQETVLGVSRNMIDVTFTKKVDTFIDVRIYSFTFILSVEFMLKLASFFSTATEAPINAYMDKSVDTKIDTKAVEPKVENTMMTLTLKIEKPDIILVESMDSIDTKALIINCEVQLKLRLLGSHQNINGSIRDFQMYTSIFDEAVRETSRVTVIEPITVSVAGSTPDGKGLHIEVYITDVFIRVSLYSIEVINKIMASMQYISEKEGSMDDTETDHSSLWEMKPEEDFWFLKEEEQAKDALVVFNLELKTDENRLNELCIMNMPVILVTLEAGIGNKTFPMLLLQCGFEGKVRDWSSQLSIEASLNLQMGYYNSYLALWEPLIEPVAEVRQNGVTVYKPWELKLEFSINPEASEMMESSIAEDQTDESTSGSIQPSANTVIDISSSNNLELTVTKTCLDVLYNLAKLFSATETTDDVGQQYIKSAPYKIINTTGILIDIILKQNEELTVVGEVQPEGDMTIHLETGAEIDLDLKKQSNSINDYVKILEGRDMSVEERFLSVTVPDMYVQLKLPIIRADTRYFMMRRHGLNWGLVSHVTIDNGVTIVTLSSNLKVHNNFSVPIDMYYMRESGNELEFISTIEASSTIYVPMKAVYSPTSELFFSVANYSVTTTPYVWRDLQLNVALSKNLACSSKTNNNENFVIRAVGEMSQVYFENTLKHTMASTIYDIFLRPAVSLKNCLPIDIVLCVQNILGETLIKSGDSIELPNVDPGQTYIVIRLPDYLEKQWSCQKEIKNNPSQFSVWTFESVDSTTKVSIDLGMHTINEKGSFSMTLYCPFWMLNKTGLQLSYRKSKKTEKNESSGSPLKSTDENTNILYHPPHFKGAILFSFNSKNFFGKKKACVRVENGEWSEKFSIDVAGSSGVIVCKNEGKIYQIGVTNRLTYNGLSKQIIFTPYYVIINNAPFAVECQEMERPADPWITVESKSCAALWPACERDDKLIKVRITDTNEISAPFMFTESHTTLLKLKNKYGGINVDIQLTEGAVYINFAMYDKGMAPALIINDTRHTMNLWEKESVQIRKLPSGHQMFYTWDNPSAQRVLVWEGGYKKELENDLRMDGVGEYAISENSNVYWVSFLDGMQRILLFTCRQTVAENAQISKQFERVDREITVSIYGVGLSIINNVKRQEIMYIGIASTGIIWETCKFNGKRYKQMSTKDNIVMEKGYQQYLLRENDGSDCSRMAVDDKTEVNYITNVMLKPQKRKIRRRFQTGLWMQMKSSPHQMQLHAKVNRLQIDNQLYDCTFPVLLAPVAPPKSIAVNNAHKPFAELSIVQLLIKNSQIRQFKYFKVLIQEFHIKVDMGFVNAIMEVFTSTETEADIKEKFVLDLNLASEALYSLVSTHSIQEQKSFYDLLHFSPLKIHVSFSMSSGGISSTNMPNFLNVLLQGIGVTLTDLQDVVFKLAFFEREYSFLTQRQLISETTTHYVGQTVKQLYVLVFGLDVIGNPYGLVLGISQGVEDLFYEPIQGAIQGPGEFAEGLALGVRSLFGHTVGGAAGAVSRITGAMGKGIAALTFDKEYQRKRRDQINKRPATVQEGIARGGKGLVMGVFDGVTGVFTKPITGAKEQGVGGFFKGLGKGAVGLVTRPTAGVMDFASTSFETVKRVTDFGHEEVMRLRAPRYVRADRFVRPYDADLAYGNKLLCELEKGKYYSTDIYSCHFVIIEKKEVLLLSDKRLAYIVHNDLFGGWQVHWSFTWPELVTSPFEVNQGVQISVESKKKNLLYGSDNNTNKIILVGEKEIRQSIIKKIINHMKIS